MRVSTIGLDIAKQTFHVVQLDARGAMVGRKKLSRGKVLSWFANHPRCLVGMEACAGSQWWARKLKALGHEVKLLPAQRVKAFVQGAKNDYNDAQAIAMAAQHRSVRAVALKSVSQQTVQGLHRVRHLVVEQRTAAINSARALALEFGVVMAKGVRVFRRELPRVLEDGDNELPDEVRAVLASQYELIATFDVREKDLEKQLARLGRDDEAVQRLREIPGIGLLSSTAGAASVGDARHWRRGRDLSASLGLVPRQHSTGGKPVLLGMSKCGDRHLRHLLVNGARSVLSWARTHARRGDALDPLQRWALQVCERRGFNKAVIAVANRLARIMWAVLHSGQRYDPQRVCAGA